jgi:hypothetical protein
VVAVAIMAAAAETATDLKLDTQDMEQAVAARLM